MILTCSFTSDDRAVTEPFTDLPALGLVALGLIAFSYLLVSAYSASASATYYAAQKEDLRAVAIAMAGDPALALDGCSGVLDSKKLGDPGSADRLLAHFGGQSGRLSARVDAGGYSWTLGSPGNGRSASCRLPITVHLNDARCVAGTLLVTVQERS